MVEAIRAHSFWFSVFGFGLFPIHARPRQQLVIITSLMIPLECASLEESRRLGASEKMLRPGGADDVTAGEVYANGIALDVVRGWLGATASDLDWDAFNDADDVDATRSRPERLGLGAKFLSHARATSLGGVSRKLGGAIARSAKRRRTDADETDSESDEASRKGAGSGGAGGGKKTGAPTTTKGMIGSGSRSDHARDASDASDSDEGGRAAAFTKRPAKKQRAPAWDPTKDVKCVGNAPGAGASKKARRKAAKRAREAEAAAARGGRSVA